MIYAQDDLLASLRALFTGAKDLTVAIKKTIDDNSELKHQVEAFVHEQIQAQRDRLVAAAKTVGGVKLVSCVLPSPIAPDAVKDLAFQISGQLPENMLCVLGSIHAEKPLLTVMISKNLVESRGLNAGRLVREAAVLIGGGGGGAAHFATAGGRNADGLQQAVDRVVELAGI